MRIKPKMATLALAATATLATVMTVAGSAGAAAAVPVTAMLQPADAGPGYGVAREEVPGNWDLDETLFQCAAAQWPVPADVADRGRILAVGGFERPAGRYVIQEVRRYPSADDARQALSAARNNVTACTEFVKYDVGSGRVHGTMRITVLAEEFAGTGSLLVRETFTMNTPSGESWTVLRVLVGKGDLVSEIRPSTRDGAEAIRLGQQAVARM